MFIKSINLLIVLSKSENCQLQLIANKYQMNFFFGGNNNQNNVITNEFNDQIKVSLKTQFCQFCNKNPATKVAFVPDFKKGFTCNNCELEAVGKDFKNLTQKTLITNQKLSDTITKSLITYQSIQTQNPQPVKQIQNQIKIHIKSTHDTIEKLKTEFKQLRSSCDNKLNELLKQSQQQNSIFVFQQLNKKCKQKKPNIQQIISVITKKSLVNKKGLHFIDQDNIQKVNHLIDERLSNAKQQSKIKLKQIEQLTEWINKIQF